MVNLDLVHEDLKTFCTHHGLDISLEPRRFIHDLFEGMSNNPSATAHTVSIYELLYNS